MQVLTVDIETFYDKTYSLSKMTTEEYVRDELFETIGVAVKVGDGVTEWFSGPYMHTKRWLDKFDWANSAVVAHNAMFDMSILNWHYDIRPGRIIDTLSMARALDGPDAGNSLAKLAERYGLGTKGTEVVNAMGKGRVDFNDVELARYGEYCINDVELTYKLFKVLGERFPLDEFKLVDLTIRMFTEPVLNLDKPALKAHLEAVQEKKASLLSKALIDKEQLMSNPKLAALLQSIGVEPPKKISPTTGKETWAFGKTDEGFKALLDHENIAVQTIVAARLGVKSTLEESRTERFIRIAERGTLPVPLRYYAAITGRWGGTEFINLQNLPRESSLKRTIMAPDGYAFIDCDSSQIEARTLAWLAGQEDLVYFFEQNNAEIAAGVPKQEMQFDPYKIMASRIYGNEVNKVTDPQRFVGKTTILGCGYGMGPLKFHAQLKAFGVDISVDECQRIITIYRRTNPMIVELWKNAQAALDGIIGQRTMSVGREGVAIANLMGIHLPNGLYLRYPNLRWEREPSGGKGMVYDQKKGRATLRTRIYGAKCVENITQALARIIIGEQMIEVAKRLRVVMTVHDAVGALTPLDKARESRKYVEQCMRMCPDWAEGLPLNCESKIGASYGG